MIPAPAGAKKEGLGFDPPIAVGILADSRRIIASTSNFAATDSGTDHPDFGPPPLRPSRLHRVCLVP